MQQAEHSTADQQAANDQQVQALLNRARQQARAFLGAERIAAWHRPRRAYDVLVLLAALVLVLVNSALLVSLPLSWLTPLLILVQGWWLQIAGLISHDLFVHRRLGGERLAAWGSLLLTVPRLSLPLGYERAHLAHHRHIGSAADSEDYKQALTTPLRRLAFSTLPGVIWLQSGRLRQAAHGYRHVQDSDPASTRRLHRERVALRLWLLLAILATLSAPVPLLLAYWLPLLLVAPLINTLRIIIEHADADVDAADAWQLGTFYHTGWFTRLLFLNEAGDCHLLHHVFPRMPFYHVGRCVDALRPLIAHHNPRPRTSLLALISSWYSGRYAHRSPWPTPLRRPHGWRARVNNMSST